MIKEKLSSSSLILPLLPPLPLLLPILLLPSSFVLLISVCSNRRRIMAVTLQQQRRKWFLKGVTNQKKMRKMPLTLPKLLRHVNARSWIFFFLYFVTFRELLIRLRTTDGKAAFIHLMSEPLLASYEEIIVHDFP